MTAREGQTARRSTRILNASDPAAIIAASLLLKSGQIVALPTESVYGLGANATCAIAVSRIYTAKGRPSDNPLIIHISSIPMLTSLLSQPIPKIYLALIEKYWPGPLTILIPKPDSIPSIVTGGTDKLAVRMPSHPFALALIEECGFPIAAPSANTSGRPSPTLASHVMSDLSGKIDLIIDGGECDVGVESTVIDGLASPPVILRPGGITIEMIRDIPGFERIIAWSGGVMEKPATPGMKYRHYTPDAQVVLCMFGKNMRDRVLGAIASALDGPTGVLSSTSTTDYGDSIMVYQLGTNTSDISRRLFQGMRELERLGCKTIIVEGVEEIGQGVAIMNRLVKAASLINAPP